MLVLASASPRRADLLRQLGLSFRIHAANIDETPHNSEPAADYVKRLALEKARAAHSFLGSGTVLGSDTAVIVDGEIFGKPTDYRDFTKMMTRLSGREHEVLSAIALIDDVKTAAALSVTKVCFRELTQDEIHNYWQTGEPEGKAGGYAIQGVAAGFIREISGSYSAVKGLPLYETSELLKKFDLWPLGKSELGNS